jgi:hypothetical protein
MEIIVLCLISWQYIVHILMLVDPFLLYTLSLYQRTFMILYIFQRIYNLPEILCDIYTLSFAKHSC